MILREQSETCMYHGCEEPSYVGIGQRWVCKKHMDEECERTGEMVEEIVRNLWKVLNEQRR